MGIKLLGRVHFLVAEAGFAKDLRLHHIGDEILKPPALQENLRTLFIHGDAQLFLACRKERIGLFEKAESTFLKKSAELFSLIRGQRICLGMKRWHLVETLWRLAVFITVPYEATVDKQNSPTPSIDFLSAGDIIKARKALLKWHSVHGRKSLPWRLNHSPYAVLVSEFMLQQTTVTTVIPRFSAWIERFPSIHDLALAEEQEVLSAWEGLGYYSRARRLHGAAKGIVSDHDGVIPKDEEALIKLPGIGPYTAASIMAFAHDRPAIVLDTNIIRVLSRWSNLNHPIDTSLGKGRLNAIAEKFFPPSESRIFASALMDLGAILCTAGLPECTTCPLQKTCRATDPAKLPKKSPRSVTTKLVEYRACFQRDGLLYLEQSRGPRWEGLWVLPELGNTKPAGRSIAQITYPFTRYSVTMKVHKVEGVVPSGLRGFSAAELLLLPMPSPIRKIIGKFPTMGGCRETANKP